jgi:hypothetical protein
LETLETMLHDAAMAPDTLRPWDAWKVFKTFARLQFYDAGTEVSVQYLHHEEWLRLYFLCELVETGPFSEEQHSACCIVCEFGFYPFRVAQPERTLWSNDYSSIDAFFTSLEGDPDFQGFMNHSPLETAVYDEGDDGVSA